MDYVISGGHTIGKARRKCNSVTELRTLGYFPLRKSSPNHPDILSDIPLDEIAIDLKSFKGEELETSVLGLFCNPVEDNFLFNFIPFEKASKLIEQVVLSRSAKIFYSIG